MPLSEEELRLLEQMERALVEEDPKFASTLRGTSLRRTARRRAIAAGVVFLVGICVLMAGVITQEWVIGVVGFVIMLGAATIGVNALRGQQAAAAEAARSAAHRAHGFTVIDGGRKSRGRSRQRRSHDGGFMERFEDRWRRRREENGGL